MAFVRWRGRTAELLATVYAQGRSRQVRLACLGGHAVDPDTRADVQARFPGIRVDWEAIDLAIASGSPAERGERAAHGWPDDRLEWLHLQRRLHYCRPDREVPAGRRAGVAQRGGHPRAVA